MSSLYRNVIQYDWNLEQGEHVAFIRYPFQELFLDPVFKVLDIDIVNSTIDVEVVDSTFLETGTQYLKQPLIGFRRVKLTTIKDDLTYNKAI